MVYLQRWHGWCHMKLLPSRRILCKPYNHAPCHFMQSHIRKVYVCSCNLPPALWAEWLGSFMCYCGNTGGGTDTEIRVSTESWPWRIKFSCHSSRDSNPWPFDHEPGTLTTELLPTPQNTFPVGQDGSYNHCNIFPAGPGRSIQEEKMSSLSKPSQYFGLRCLYVVGACDVYTFLVEDTGCYCLYIMGGHWFSWEIYVAEGVDGIWIKNIWHLHVVKGGQHSCHYVHISVYELRYLRNTSWTKLQ